LGCILLDWIFYGVSFGESFFKFFIEGIHYRIKSILIFIYLANSDSDDSDRLSTAFHIDGAISHEKMSSRLIGVVPNCCSGESTPRATFV